MASPGLRYVCAVLLVLSADFALGQQSVIPPAQFGGTLLAQNDPAIDRARLQRDLAPPVSIGVDANGTAIAATEPTESEDDSFGAQVILKQQERMRSFVVTGGVAVNYTNNVALTRRDERHDLFVVADAGLGLSRR
ncbi:MAG TPA: hypothetical protein VG095_09870, partial [Chthoniobacterales bacterium]|nr:hypothetical protein [Chthoniobacterales bacterium]